MNISIQGYKPLSKTLILGSAGAKNEEVEKQMKSFETVKSLLAQNLTTITEICK